MSAIEPRRRAVYSPGLSQVLTNGIYRGVEYEKWDDAHGLIMTGWRTASLKMNVRNAIGPGLI
jgi:hypothetical protein